MSMLMREMELIKAREQASGCVRLPLLRACVSLIHTSQRLKCALSCRQASTAAVVPATAVRGDVHGPAQAVGRAVVVEGVRSLPRCLLVPAVRLSIEGRSAPRVEPPLAVWLCGCVGHGCVRDDAVTVGSARGRCWIDPTR